VKSDFLVALLFIGSTSLAAQQNKRGCPDMPSDTSSKSRPVYEACQVDQEARQRGSSPRVEWQPPSADLRNGACYSADFRFVVDTLGAPELESIVEVGGFDESFRQAVKDVIPRLRYEPAKLKGAPVRQIVAYKQSAAMRVVVSSSPIGGRPPSSSRPPNC